MSIRFNQCSKKLFIVTKSVGVFSQMYFLSLLLENRGEYYSNLYNDLKVEKHEIWDFEDLHMLNLQDFFGFYAVNQKGEFSNSRNLFCNVLVECSSFNQSF